MATTLDTAVTTAEALFAKGRIARRAWRLTLDDGREAVCAWLALGGSEYDYSACAALGISEPLARLIPWLDDAGSDAAWRPRMARLFALLRRTPVLTPEDWTILEYTWRRLAVEEAMRHIDEERVLAVAHAVVELCACAEAGEHVPPEQWATALEKARATETTAGWAARAAASRRVAAADRLASAILDALEARIVAREATA